MRDIDIRRALIAKMDEIHKGDTDTRIVEELGLCQGVARVDLAVVNGSVHGYEIKSQHDTLNRLPSQAIAYSQALEFVTIVAAPDHLSKIEALVPIWWGIWKATQIGSEIRIETLREGQRNPTLLPMALAQFLWRDEALAILEEHKLATGMTSKSRNHLWLRLTATFTTDQLGEFVRTRLKLRGEDWRALS